MLTLPCRKHFAYLDNVFHYELQKWGTGQSQKCLSPLFHDLSTPLLQLLAVFVLEESEI